jgi:outer membrane biosynthesis protein TonB
LTEQAIAAARQIRFEPAKKNGVPQTVTNQVQYQFTLY